MVAAIVAFIISAILVDLIGYWLHRLAHRPIAGRLYAAHMVHHVDRYPPNNFISERYRPSGGIDSLVIWFLPFGLLYVAAAWLLDLPQLTMIVAGGLTVAIANSVMHDMSHVGGSFIWTRKLFASLGRRHRTHHRKMGKNFGILFGIWDHLFRTAAATAVTQE